MCFLSRFVPFRSVVCPDLHSPTLACLSRDFGATHTQNAHHAEQSSISKKTQAHTLAIKCVEAQLKCTHDTQTQHTQPCRASYKQQLLCFSIVCSAPCRSHLWDTTSRASNPYHTLTHTIQPDQTFLLKPHRNQHKFTHTVQQYTTLIPNRCREGLERLQKVPRSSYGLCIEKRNEVDSF